MKKLITLIAEVLSGTQVPISLGKHILGTATKPLYEIRDRLHLLGYLSTNEIEVELRKFIEEK